MPQDIPYALEIPRVTLTRAIGPEAVALQAIRVARTHLEGSPEGADGDDAGRRARSFSLAESRA
jgi:hypothetical protein